MSLYLYAAIVVIIACTLGGFGVAVVAYRHAIRVGFGLWFVVQMLSAALWMLPAVGFAIGWQRAATQPQRITVVVKHNP